MEKRESFHHSVTENGNIQVRIGSEYVKNNKGQGKKYGKPMTPADTKKVTDWDSKSQNIVAAIIDDKVLADFEVEKNAVEVDGAVCKHPSKITGVGVEEAVSFDRVVDDHYRISVRRITRIFDDGEEVSKKYHRTWIMPGQNPGNADVMSRALAVKMHTPEVVQAYEGFNASLLTAPMMIEE